MEPNPQETADLVTFAEEILDEKFHFVCSISFGQRNVRYIMYTLLAIICSYLKFSQPAFTCSKLTIETHAIGVSPVSLLVTLNIFRTFFQCFYVNFEHVIAGWVLQKDQRAPFVLKYVQFKKYILKYIMKYIMKSITSVIMFMFVQWKNVPCLKME